MKNVLIPTKLNEIARSLLEEKGFTIVQDPETPLAELAKAHPETGALIVRSEKVTAEVIDLLPRLRVVIRAGAGYNTIDTKYARRKGVDVMNTPGANANAVAEEVFALALAHYRFVVPADASTRSGAWEKKTFMGRELAGKTLGIIGLGNIGQLVARHAAGFDMTLLGFDPVMSASRANEFGVKLVDLDTIFSESDLVSLHVPETAETIGMVNARRLGLMKPGATLINCARAGIVDEDALREAKKTKDIGFCNDVYAADAEGEKSVRDIAEVMLPHLGANTHEANYNAARRAAEQLIAFVERGVTRYVVNRGVPEGLDEGFQQLAYLVASVARHYLGNVKSVRQIECSLYGGLDEYAQWFLSPIVAGISTDFDPLSDAQEAEDYLEEMGVSFALRSTDETKRYGKSLTIDLLGGKGTIRQVSVRGTIAEGNVMISRVNDFDRLYFQPQGHSFVAVYRDRPGVIAGITRACADADINIEDIRAPHDSEALNALAVLKTNKRVPADIVERIQAEIDAEVAFAMSID
ncbi:MAG: ACT domain-containing protein [Lentisphaerae bacterium]|jgi:D-3-phosphoglycerate dehydrogenase / 2-oxoglutarate reductase|nr:ACT domain-containing protein [Lentisphaerota bacterium]MBT5607424.1 ACT domain-containing protein [Lentisphaerota bacterium]MBT7056132.1 ACT domain-containing protein [Lentisphaerota bacterium]MBT7841370.1 ACT domain-containing protein [Lentisphaerota bacterium]